MESEILDLHTCRAQSFASAARPKGVKIETGLSRSSASALVVELFSTTELWFGGSRETSERMFMVGISEMFSLSEFFARSSVKQHPPTMEGSNGERVAEEKSFC